MSFFSVLYRSSKRGSRARIGRIQTEHGVIETPAFVSVGTKGTLKGVSSAQAISIGTQASFVNTYHLAVYPSADVIASHGSIHSFAQFNWSVFSDSGGFQVFSLAKQSKKGKLRQEGEALLVSLNEDRVMFRSTFDGSLLEFSPETSIAYQKKIGADILMAFDECTYYPAPHGYALRAMERTHKWLERSIVAHKKSPHHLHTQYLYGVIQGATFEDLRIASAQFVRDQPSDGVAIGGVSVGESKNELRQQVQWVSPYLPEDKPVHLLGVGQIDDIVSLVRYGIDTFDCVEPTRLARMGTLLYVHNIEDPIQNWTMEKVDITGLIHKHQAETITSYSEEVVDVTYSYFHHLFKQRELLGYTLATLHNLALMEKLMCRIREEIERNNV